MSVLFTTLPFSVKVQGVEYMIDPDYRIMARFEQGILTGDRGDKKAMSKLILDCLLAFYKENIPPDVSGAIDMMWWFYRCGEPIQSDVNKAGTKQYKRLYDYEIDGALIASAFADTYGIDIVSQQLHWWQFKAYFLGLKEDTRFVKIMSYRGMDLKGLKGQQRKFYAELQKKYELPEVHQTPMTKEERDQTFREQKMKRIRELQKKSGE